MSKKRVLVVDDEQDMLWMLQRNLNKGMPDVEVLTASSGEEALALLSDTPVELVITDINMPGMNGLDLLIEINNRYPETGVIIMTAYPSIAYEREAMMSGSLRFVEKPFDIKDMRAIVKTVLKESDGFQGTVSGIDLLDIIQFNGLSRATSALKVTTSDDEGMIFFREGEVVHAMCDQLTGEDAFFKIIGLTDGTIQNIRGVEAPIVSIKKKSRFTAAGDRGSRR
jgi:DNA-binding response OmpR family regulator